MTCTVFGTVYDSGSTVLTAAVVSTPNVNVNNASGSYYFQTATSGTFNVTATCANYVQQTIAVPVANGQSKSQDFHLTHV
ncbi:MAG: hypothetical protein H0W83_18350 [Planctomycetes bacterium]|nr:hypothetical protein [Planctomycetota bacterium]